MGLQSESEQSPWAESEQCSVEEFHYVTKAMFRYSVLATAQSAKVRLTLLSRSCAHACGGVQLAKHVRVHAVVSVFVRRPAV